LVFLLISRIQLSFDAFIHWSRVYIVFAPFLFAPYMWLIFFSSFLYILCGFHLFARVPQVVCVPPYFSPPFIYSRCCTFAPHKANKFICLSLPIFLFIYFACLRISWVCLLARAKERQVTHKVTNSLTSSGLCLLVPGVLSFPPFLLFLALVLLLSCS